MSMPSGIPPPPGMGIEPPRGMLVLPMGMLLMPLPYMGALMGMELLMRCMLLAMPLGMLLTMPLGTLPGIGMPIGILLPMGKEE